MRYTEPVLGALSSLVLSTWIATAPGISEAVHTKSATATFTATHELRLEGGRIWWRPRSATASALEPWALLPPDGVPAPRWRMAAAKKKLGLRGTVKDGAFDVPYRLVAIAADGDDLIAVDATRRVFHTRLSAIEWRDRFGPGDAGGLLRIPIGPAPTMSERRVPWIDIDGNTHPAQESVSTLYTLSADGSHLYFGDRRGWPRLDGEMCLPERGAFRARAVAASASVVAVLDDGGRVFTRLADFDSLGSDPQAHYSWRRERRSGTRSDVRSLPPEPWRAQPPLPGAFAPEVTVLQVGREQAARELRVPAHGGYWRKPVLGDSWSFVATGLPRADTQVPAGLPPRGPRRDVAMAGATWHGAETRLELFDPVCPPAQVIVERDGERVVLELWMRENLARLPKGDEMSGALLFPSSARGALANDVRALLGDTMVEVNVGIDGRKVTVRSANATRAEPRLTFTRR